MERAADYHAVMRRSRVRGVVVGFWLFVACGGGEPEADIAEYTDALGRACKVDRNDISLTAECDVDPPVTCEAGSEAAFALSGDLEGRLRNCGACVDAANHQTFIDGPSCAQVTCGADADCVESRYTCQAGLCAE